jgi:hypothetical protein
MPIVQFVPAQADFIDDPGHGGCAGPVPSLNPRHMNQSPLRRAMEFSMRAETQNLVEEIKQSVRLLRRHL